MPTQTITPPAERNIGQDVFDAVFPNSLDFRVQLPYSDAIEFIRLIGDYNNFQPGTVTDALERIDWLIPRTHHATDHPDNGQRNYRLSVGREGSPVIYIERYEFGFLEQSVHRLSEATMQTICQEMELCALADEASVDVVELSGGSRKITFRFWWD